MLLLLGDIEKTCAILNTWKEKSAFEVGGKKSQQDDIKSQIYISKRVCVQY